MIVAQGRLTPGPGHTLRGSFTIRQTGEGLLMETSDDFFFDGSPTPGFALNTGIPTDAADLALQSRMEGTRFLDLPGGVVTVQGRQAGTIPPDLDLDAFDTLVLWCFAVPFILGFGPIDRVQTP
ncbi:hypothetical protein [Paracoccus sp. AK26]|uniref:hypothetical protein n=1 Tax=Paracoccus sp. AK26 TaxID=2589076 RepID=UPI001427EE93|nr:hypothetical protein [Paracoccus sp. AK26]QIR86484.1 hypothetical protein FIU66_14290 [Paracoccus sp. AK26]